MEGSGGHPCGGLPPSAQGRIWRSEFLAVRQSRTRRLIVATTLAATIPILAAPWSAAAGPASSGDADAASQRGLCSTIKAGKSTRAFYKERMSCRGAKRRTRKVIRSNGKRKPKGFKCASEGKRWKKNGVCVSRKRPERNFGWHPR